jgi:hypothetical protein
MRPGRTFEYMITASLDAHDSFAALRVDLRFYTINVLMARLDLSAKFSLRCPAPLVCE